MIIYIYCDNNGVVQSGEETVKVWSEHFREVLQSGKESPAGCSEPSVCSEVNQGSEQWSSLGLDDELTREEVMWALGKAKRMKSPGRDGISVEMMDMEALSDVWVNLFNVCWKFGVVPSLWKCSIIVLIPKGRVNNQLASFLEAEEILVDEQGGFRRSRGCRVQILSLLLIGQSMVAKKSTE